MAMIAMRAITPRETFFVVFMVFCFSGGFYPEVKLNYVNYQIVPTPLKRRGQSDKKHNIKTMYLKNNIP